MKHICLLLLAACLIGAESKDISGTWIAKMQSPMGEMEIVYKLKVDHGLITGSQSMPFGDAPIVRGRVEGDRFEFTVKLDMFGKVQELPVKGRIKGDELELTPAMPKPPEGMGGPGGPAPPEGMDGPGGPKPPEGGGGAGMMRGPVIARRGVPAPSFRAPSVDYAALPAVELPAIVDIPSNGLARTPPMGWNSWNKFHANIDDKTVREIAEAMVANGMKDAGYAYINIDDGWQWKRDASGRLLPNPNFPDMKALASYVHSKGLKIGIYSSPGPTTCGGYVGSYGHEEQDAQMWADWGIDYLKYDWCSASNVWKEADMRALYQRMGAALRKTGRPIVYSLCQYGLAGVEKWGPKVGGNLWRTTVDIFDRYESMARIGFAQSDLAPYAAPGHWNDPDMLEVGNGGMTPVEYRMHFSLWAMAAAPLIAGNDLRKMDEETRSILLNREVIAVNQDPLGKGGQRLSGTGKTEVWTKPLDGGASAIALFNRGDAEATVSVKWSDLNLGGERNIRDLWAHADRGRSADGYSAAVPAHGAVMIRISEPRR